MMSSRQAIRAKRALTSIVLVVDLTLWPIAGVVGCNSRGDQKPEGGEHFKNTVLYVYSNRWAKHKMGGHRFQTGGWGRAPLAPRWRRPWLYFSLLIRRGIYVACSCCAGVTATIKAFPFFPRNSGREGH